MERNEQYEKFVFDVLDIISEMRSTSDFHEPTLEALEWRLEEPKQEREDN
jgi:hypothetical protein